MFEKIGKLIGSAMDKMIEKLNKVLNKIRNLINNDTSVDNNVINDVKRGLVFAAVVAVIVNEVGITALIMRKLSISLVLAVLLVDTGFILCNTGYSRLKLKEENKNEELYQIS